MKRLMMFCATGLLSCSMTISAFGAVQTNAGKWAVPYMEKAFEAGLLPQESLQKATSPMTRLDFCKMAVDFLEEVTGERPVAKGQSPFRDCQDQDVTAAYEAGIVGGLSEGVFQPEGILTREQMAIMIGRTLAACNLDLSGDALRNTFSDTKELYASSNEYIDRLYGAKIIAGYENHTFAPFRQLKVQEAVTAFVRAYEYALSHREEISVQKEAAEAADSSKKETPAETTPAVKEETVPSKTDTETAKEEKTTKEETTEKAENSEGMDRVAIAGKTVILGKTAEELKAVWGEPDRVDETVYGLERYIYLNEYQNYFFVTFQEGKIVEIFIPGSDFLFMGTDGTGTSADIKNLTYISAVEHSGVIKSDLSEARFPLDYAGNICGFLLQTSDFIKTKDAMSMLHTSLKEDLAAELLDLIQVKRMEEKMPLLQEEAKLQEVAGKHSADMVKNHYFAYNSPDGTTPFSRIMERGKTFSNASEVIARQRGDVVNVYQEWIRTPAGMSSLMDSSMQEVGIGVESLSKTLYVTVDLCGQIN